MISDSQVPRRFVSSVTYRTNSTAATNPLWNVQVRPGPYSTYSVPRSMVGNNCDPSTVNSTNGAAYEPALLKLSRWNGHTSIVPSSDIRHGWSRSFCPKGGTMGLVNDHPVDFVTRCSGSGRRRLEGLPEGQV
jgi:hypothetical protein